MPWRGSSLISLEGCSNREVPDEWEKANVTHNFEQGEKESLVTYSLANVTSVPGMVIEQILLQSLPST